MRLFRVLPVVVVMVLAQCMAALPPMPQGGTAYIDSAAHRAPLNAVRAQHGLAPLAIDARLGRIAAAHAQDMLDNGFFGHTGSDGGTLIGRARAEGYPFCYVAENLALGHDRHDQTLQLWLDSPLHRRNLLSDQPTRFGLARGPGNLWVLVLGRPGCARGGAATFI